MTHDPSLAGAIAASGLVAGTGTALDDPGLLTDMGRCLAALATVLDRLAETAVAIEELCPPAPASPWSTPESIVTAAQVALAEGRIDPESLGPAYRHVAPGRLVDALEEGVDALRQRASTPVLTNGAVTLSNVRVDAGDVAGLSDWSRAAVSDRHRDLAITARSLIADWGPGVIPTLVSQLRIQPDPVVLDWYMIAIELVD